MLPPPLPVVSRGDGGAVPEPEVAAFLSYVHADDAAEGGRIVRIAEDVCSQYELTTGERLTIFQDLGERSLCGDLAAFFPGLGSKV